MKICSRIVNYMQLWNSDGDVRFCAWLKDCHNGNILRETIPEMRHGENMKALVAALSAGDYSVCQYDWCPHLCNGTMDEMLIDVDEIPDYPETLSLSFEENCNYRCTCCAPCEQMETALRGDYSEKYDQIEKRLKDVLPHIKHLSAHGIAELFASPRTLRLLADWQPLAPAEECKASLETNGSLFTPENWKKIENLGRYDLSVTVTVMSFQEDIYQHLSGTKLPISVILNNLKFLQSLREQGVINHFKLRTVVQEANFREMPAFVKRCFDDFGADGVNLLQLKAGGRYSPHIQWFMDVRNPEHPYYEQYVKVMSDPILHDPRVLIWSGDRPSDWWGEHPGVALEHQVRRHEALQSAVNKLLDDPELLLGKLPAGRLGVFGMGTLGRLIVSQYRDKLNICRAYATNPRFDAYQGVPVTPLCEAGRFEAPDTILATPYSDFEGVSAQLRKTLGAEVDVVNFWDMI